jgi:type I restriction enzyme M protein
VVANPPFSDKRWSTGIDPLPAIPTSASSRSARRRKTGRLRLPAAHRPLAQEHRQRRVHPAARRAVSAAMPRPTSAAPWCARATSKGIIGLPANLFYGTGIPACIVVLDKENAHARKGIFMIDASKGFIKDGPKNRLREQDIHKIVDAFTKRQDLPKYSRMVPLEPRSQTPTTSTSTCRATSTADEPEDRQDIEGHCGRHPKRDVDALERYWKVCPKLRNALVRISRKTPRLQLDLKLPKAPRSNPPSLRTPSSPPSIAGSNAQVFAAWRTRTAQPR